MLHVCEQETEKIRATIFRFKICFLNGKEYLNIQIYIQETYCSSHKIAVIKKSCLELYI